MLSAEPVTVCVAAVVIAIQACGSNERRGPPNELAAKIDATARGPAIFTFQYTAPPPDGRQVHFAAFDGVSGAPCAIFRGEEPENFNVFNVVLSRAKRQTFTVTARPELASDGTAYVEWVQVVGGRPTATLRAVGGSVTYRSGPMDEVEWAADAAATLGVAAEFETDPVSRANCSGGWLPDGSTSTANCLCTRWSGLVFECSSDESSDCCRAHLQIDISRGAHDRRRQMQCRLWCHRSRIDKILPRALTFFDRQAYRSSVTR